MQECSKITYTVYYTCLLGRRILTKRDPWGYFSDRYEYVYDRKVEKSRSFKTMEKAMEFFTFLNSGKETSNILYNLHKEDLRYIGPSSLWGTANAKMKIMEIKDKDDRISQHNPIS